MFWTNDQGKEFRDKHTDQFSRDWKHASNEEERLSGESQVEIGKGEVLTPRNESRWLFTWHQLLTLPSPTHLFIYQLLRLRLLGWLGKQGAWSPAWPHMHRLGARDTYPCSLLTESGECCEEGYTTPLGDWKLEHWTRRSWEDETDGYGGQLGPKEQHIGISGVSFLLLF